MSPAGHQGPCGSAWDTAQEQKGDEGEAGRGRAHAPRTMVGGARTPQAWPRKVWLLGVAATQGELLCPGPGLPPRTDPWKGLFTGVGTHIPADSPPLARKCQHIEQSQHLHGTPCCQPCISGEGAWQNTDDFSFSWTFSSGSRGLFMHHTGVLLPAGRFT